jgi:CRP-like cAMP-binding protein
MSILLESLPERDRGPIAATLDRCPVIALPRGTKRLARRLPPASLLVVEEGTVAVSRLPSRTTRQIAIALRRAGGILLPLEEDECLCGVTDAWLTGLTSAAIRALHSSPVTAAALTDGLLQALSCARETVRQFASVRAADRLREKLLQLGRDHGHVGVGGITLDLPLTHELLAEMIGSSRETVTWAFAELMRDGFVRREGRCYRLVVSPDELAS